MRHDVLGRAALASAIIVCVLAVLALAGWMTGTTTLASFGPDLIPMAPNTAVAFLLLAGPRVLRPREEPGLAGRLAAGAVGGVAVITLTQAVLGRDLGVDHWVLSIPGRFGEVPLGAMSPLTATCFALLAGSEIADGEGRARSASAGALALAALVVAVGAVLGYAHGAPLLYGTPTIPMALTTALAFVLAASSFLLGRPSRWPLAMFDGSDVKPQLLRALVPATALTVLGMGLVSALFLSGLDAHPAVLIAIAAVATTAVVVFVVTRASRGVAAAIERAEAIQRALEAQLRQTQKMELLGQLAGSVAHDFNNLLTVILSFTRFTIDAIPADHPSARDLDEVVRAAERATALTSQLLAFTRKQVIIPKDLDISGILGEMDRMLRRLLGERIDLVVRADESLFVRADRSHFEQIVLNLAVNARDAMPHGGKLTIETSEMTIDGEHVRGRLGAPSGDYVTIAITDTGCGMDESTAGRIFEPFFTTKPEGRGTGLGLATVHGILKEYGGDVSVYSQLGRGTTFRVYLPRRAPEIVSTEGAPASGPAPKGSERILLVDDDVGVRIAASRILRALGYDVIEVSTIEDARRRLAESAERIDLLLTDVVLPDGDGPDLARHARANSPTLRVLFMSGYAAGALAHQGLVELDAAYMPKPFVPKELARRIRGVLDDAPRGPCAL